MDEKGIQYHYVDASNITHELLTNLRMYCDTYPIVVGLKYFSTFNETLEHFHKIWIPALQEDFFPSFYFEDSLKVIPKFRTCYTISLINGL